MTGHITPEPGDVIVEEQHGGGKVVYVLHMAQGPSQVLLHSRQDAVAEAITFAKRQHVRAWLANREHAFELLEDFRRATSR